MSRPHANGGGPTVPPGSGSDDPLTSLRAAVCTSGLTENSGPGLGAPRLAEREWCIVAVPIRGCLPEPWNTEGEKGRLLRGSIEIVARARRLPTVAELRSLALAVADQVLGSQDRWGGRPAVLLLLLKRGSCWRPQGFLA
jgi:hypothetical protein